MSEFTFAELVEREEKYRAFGYKEGRKYVMDSLDDCYNEASTEVQQFIMKFQRAHRDNNVEIR